MKISDEFRLRIYDFIAAPAHLWLWCCARLMGWTFEFIDVDDDEEETNDDE